MNDDHAESISHRSGILQTERGTGARHAAPRSALNPQPPSTTTSSPTSHNHANHIHHPTTPRIHTSAVPAADIALVRRPRLLDPLPAGGMLPQLPPPLIHITAPGIPAQPRRRSRRSQHHTGAISIAGPGALPASSAARRTGLFLLLLRGRNILFAR